MDRHPALSRALIAAGVLLAVTASAAGVHAAASEIVVGPLAVVSGTATGTASGFAAGSQVTVDGTTQQADASGTVTLAAAPLDGDGRLTLAFTDSDGTAQTVTVDLTDSVTGLPLSPAEILDPLASTTREVRVTVGDGGSGGDGGSTGSGGGGAGTTPPGASSPTGGSVSIPASSVAAGEARLVIAGVAFNPVTLRSLKQPIRAQVTVKDTRGLLVRDAIVLIRGVPERRLVPVAEARTNENGVVVFTLRPTKLLPLRAGGRLTMFVRARKAGEPINGGVSTRRLVSLRISRPRSG